MNKESCHLSFGEDSLLFWENVVACKEKLASVSHF